MNYGLPYMGSKNKIAEWVLSYLPKAENFYDLFCGGCAITHCAMVHKKYENYVINDIKGIMPQLFVDCLNGTYKDEKRWISREDFFRLKDTDGYVHTCFSFGNKGQTYLYGENVECLKKAVHYAICYDEYNLLLEYGLDCTELKNIVGIENKRKYFKKILDKYAKIGLTKKVGSHYTFNGIVNFDQLQNLERLERLKIISNIKSAKGNFDLQNIEALNRLQKLEAKGNIVNYNKSYDEIDIKPNSVIYCDIPYKNTGTYNEDAFDYDKFYDWALKQTEPIFISEYNMPGDFICIAERNKLSSMSPTSNSTKSVERIFVPKHQYKDNKQQVEQLRMF